MNSGDEYSVSGSSDDVRLMVSGRAGGGDEGSQMDQHRQLEWDTLVDAGYDGNQHPIDFRWTPASSADNVLLSNAPDASRFVGMFPNENEDEFYSIASTEYLSIEDDLSPRRNSENQHIHLTFPKMALTLNLDVTVSDVDPTIGKLELTCSAVENSNKSTRQNGISNCEMWLNGQHLQQQQASRSSSSDIDLIPESLFPDFENLKSSSDSKLSTDISATEASNRFSEESLKTRLDHVRKNYRLFNFQDEEENKNLDKQIDESSATLDRLIDWFNSGCSSELHVNDSDSVILQGGPSRQTSTSVNDNPVGRGIESSSSAVDSDDLPEMPYLPPLPASPPPSCDSFNESRDSLSNCEDAYTPMTDSRPSWLTVYTSNTQFNQENGRRSNDVIHTRQNQLEFDTQTADTEENNQTLIDDSAFDDDESASKSSIQTEDVLEQTQTNKLENISSAELFDSAFGSMLKNLTEDTEPQASMSRSTDRGGFADTFTGHEEEDMGHISDSHLSRKESGNFQFRNELNMPSEENLDLNSSFIISTKGSTSNDINKTEERKLSTSSECLVSKDSIYQNSWLPSLPASPPPSCDRLYESRDSLSNCEDTYTPMTDAHPSWLTIYTSNTQFHLENGLISNDVIHTRQNQLDIDTQMADIEENNQTLVDDSAFDDNEYASTSSTQTDDVSEQTQTNKFENISSAELFDSAFGSMLKKLIEDTEPQASVSRSTDRGGFADTFTGHEEENMSHSSDSHLSRKESENLQFRHELNMPSEENLDLNSSFNISTKGSISDHIDKTEKGRKLSTSSECWVSKDSIYQNSWTKETSMIKHCSDKSFNGDFTSSKIFNKITDIRDGYNDKSSRRNLVDQRLDTEPRIEKSCEQSSENINKDQSAATESDVQSNEEKLRGLAMSYGLLDDAEMGYESYDSEDSETFENGSQKTSRKGWQRDDDSNSDRVDKGVCDGAIDEVQSSIGNDTKSASSSEQASHDIDTNTTSSTSSSYQHSKKDVPAKPSSTYDIFDFSSLETLPMIESVEKVQQNLLEHKERKELPSNSLFSFSDEDQVDFLSKFQYYIETLDIGLYDSTVDGLSRTSQEVDNDNYFSMANEFNVKKYLGNQACPSTSHSDASETILLTDTSHLLDKIARKVATNIVSDVSLSGKNSIQSLPGTGSCSTCFSDLLDIHSSNGSLDINDEKGLRLLPQNSDQNVESTSSTVFSCPYFDDICRLDMFNPVAEEVMKWPTVTTYSVSDLVSRSHSQFIDMLNADKTVDLIQYSLDVYKEDGNGVITKNKADAGSSQLSNSFSDSTGTSQSRSEEQKNTPNDSLTAQSDVESHVTKEESETESRLDDDESPCGNQSEENQQDSCDFITQIPSDRFLFSAKSWTFLENNEYDAEHRDSSKGPIVAAIEHEALQQYASLLVKKVISVAHKKFVWSMNGSQENDASCLEQVSLGSDTSQTSRKTTSSEHQQGKRKRNEENDEGPFGGASSSSQESQGDKHSNVHISRNAYNAQALVFFDYGRTVIAAGLSSIAIRQGMEELRLNACREWHSSSMDTDEEPSDSSPSTSTTETVSKADNYKKYKSKLKELKKKRQRGGRRKNKNSEKTVDRKSRFINDTSSSDETTDDSSDDDVEDDEEACFIAFRKKMDETACTAITKMLDTMRMVLIARQDHHFGRLDRCKHRAEPFFPDVYCPRHDDAVSPPTQDSVPITSICTCSTERTEALTSLAREIFRGKDLEKTVSNLLKFEEEHKDTRVNLISCKNLFFSSKKIGKPTSKDVKEEIDYTTRTECDRFQLYMGNYKMYPHEFENTLSRIHVRSFKDIKPFLSESQIEREPKHIDMDTFIKESRRVYDESAEDPRKYSRSATCTGHSVVNNLGDIGHQEGMQSSDEKYCNSTEAEDDLYEQTARLVRIAAQALQVDTSRAFLSEEYRHLKDNRLGVDVTTMEPEKATPNEGQLSPRVTPRCSICKLRKKVNKVDTAVANDTIQATNSCETTTGSSATVKRFGGHDYGVGTGCGIRKHKVTCALCKTRKDVGV